MLELIIAVSIPLTLFLLITVLIPRIRYRIHYGVWPNSLHGYDEFVPDWGGYGWALFYIGGFILTLVIPFFV